MSETEPALLIRGRGFVVASVFIGTPNVLHAYFIRNYRGTIRWNARYAGSLELLQRIKQFIVRRTQEVAFLELFEKQKSEDQRFEKSRIQMPCIMAMFAW